MLHYNPAALILADDPQLEMNVFLPKGSVKVEQGGETYRLDNDWLVSGSLFYSHPFEHAGRRYAIAAGLRLPYGQEASWLETVPFAPFGYKADMSHYEYLLGGGVELGKGFSLGANLFFADSDISTASAGTVFPTDQQRFSGSDQGWGFQLALHHQVNERFSWGMNYRSGLKLDYSGDIDYNAGIPGVPDAQFPASSSIDFPEHFTIGCEWQATERLSLGLQAQWTRWSVVEQIEITSPAGAAIQPVNWGNGWILSAGGTWTVNEIIDLHFGYMFTESIIEEPFHTPLTGDFDQHFLSAGFTAHHGSWSYDLAVIHVLEADRTISNSLYGFAGEHESSSWLVNAGATFTF